MKRSFSFITSSFGSSARAAMFALCTLAMVACSDDPTANDNPDKPTTKEISKVVEWMDGRLKNEYYWLDEYNEKHSSFDLTLAWDKFLDATLKKLTTNSDDGSIIDGTRHFYTTVYRDEKDDVVASATRSDFPTVRGYGILLSPYVINEVEGYSEDDYGYVVEHIYPGSQAEQAGLKRGDTIMKINGTTIGAHNYQELYNTVIGGKTPIELEVYSLNEESGESEILTCDLTAAHHEENPVAYSGILDLDKELFNVGDKKIGYLCYLAFEADFDMKLIDAVTELVEGGATDVILDLRANSGGHVTSSALLASMLLDESYAMGDKVYAHLIHNPKNKVSEDSDYHLIQKYTPEDSSVAVDIPNLGLKKVWVICSEISASASEMVIVGLRGLDVEVELVGNITEGKNCGMRVTYYPGPSDDEFDSEGYRYTFAPITFMIENGKGFSDYGDGITPEHYLREKSKDKNLSKDLRSACGYFPVPEVAWGDVTRDVALCETVLQICGESLFDSPSDQAFARNSLMTRSGLGSMPQRTSLKAERTDLKSLGMIVREQDIQ